MVVELRTFSHNHDNLQKSCIYSVLISRVYANCILELNIVFLLTQIKPLSLLVESNEYLSAQQISSLDEFLMTYFTVVISGESPDITTV